jgi:outer membrane protein OmpA-like peptidoglycan-associated protein
MTLPKETNIVSVPTSNQYALCDGCPALTRMNENVMEERQPAKMAIRFSEKPDILAKPRQQGPALEDRHESLPLMTVYFDLDSARVKGGERKKIEGAVPSLRMKAPLKVTGFTCDLGSQAHNDRLALQRAQSVKSALIRSGLRRGDIAVVEGKGKCCFADTSPARHFANRRVEIESQD